MPVFCRANLGLMPRLTVAKSFDDNLSSFCRRASAVRARKDVCGSSNRITMIWSDIVVTLGRGGKAASFGKDEKRMRTRSGLVSGHVCSNTLRPVAFQPPKGAVELDMRRFFKHGFANWNGLHGEDSEFDS